MACTSFTISSGLHYFSIIVALTCVYRYYTHLLLAACCCPCLCCRCLSQVARLTAANSKLQGQVSSLNSSKMELLDRMAALTNKWRATVAECHELQRQVIGAKTEAAALQQQLMQLHQGGATR